MERDEYVIEMRTKISKARERLQRIKVSNATQDKVDDIKDALNEIDKKLDRIATTLDNVWFYIKTDLDEMWQDIESFLVDNDKQGKVKKDS